MKFIKKTNQSRATLSGGFCDSYRDAVFAGSIRDWSHVTDQIGMFCYSGLNQDQVQKLQTDYAIYMTKDGRISMVSLAPNNIDYVAKAIHLVTK